MTLKTCKDCIHGAICTICDYDDVLNVNDYCGYFKDKADVAEVKHGYWKPKHYEGGFMDGTNFEECSTCRYRRYFDDIRFKLTFDYCPKCGAQMDLKEGAEE